MKKLSLITILVFALAIGFAQTVEINFEPAQLTFTYPFGGGPSTPQTITVSGSGLQAGKSILIDALGTKFEVCATENGTYSGTLRVFSDGNGYVAPTIVYVRMDKDLAIGNYSDNIYLGYYLGPVVEKTLQCSGSVTDPTLPVELSHFSATLTAQNYVLLNWVSQSESNLLGYYLYRNDSFDLSTAIQVSGLIAGTNTSSTQTYNYYDKDLTEEGTYYYWLQSVDMDGSNGFHGPVSVVFCITIEGGAPEIPVFTQLKDAFPNPFNPSTTFCYQLEDPANVRIDVYNQRGQIVRSFERYHSAPGNYNIFWDGCDSYGKELTSGIYLYRMSSGNYSSTKKIVLQK